jgi:nucleotide-binding universal stress UspA family protein
MATVHEIVVATDIERPARAALRCSFLIADQFHASVSVVHAWSPGAGLPRNPGMARQQPPVDALLRRRLEALVREIPTGMPGCASVEIVDGPAAATVLTYASRQKSDLVVLGSSSHAATIFGAPHTIVRDVSRGAPCPVLTVPDTASAPLQRLERILLLVGETSMELATQSAALFAWRFRAVVELLHVAVDSDSRSPAAPRRRELEVEEALRLAGVAVERHVDSTETDPGRCVLTRLEQGGCDLVVMNMDRRDTGECPVATVRRCSTVPILSVCPDVSDGSFARHGMPGRGSDAVRSGAVA